MSRGRWLLLAFAAVSLFVLRPICLAQAALPAHAYAPAAHSHAAHASDGAPGSHEPVCCTAFDDAVLVQSTEATASVVDCSDAAAPAYAVPVVASFTHAPAPRSRSAPGALEQVKSYHARSARILR